MRVLKVIGATIFTILFTIVLTSGLVITSISRSLSPDNVEIMLRENTELIEEVIDIDWEEYFDLEGALGFEADEIFDTDAINEIIINLTVDIFHYLFSDGDLPMISADDVNSIVRAEVLDSFDEEQRAIWEVEAAEMASEINADLEEALILDEEMQEVMEVLGLFFDSNTRNGFIIAVVILAGLVALSLLSLYRPLAWLGTGSVIAGAIMSLFALILRAEAADPSWAPLAELVLNNLIREATIIGIILLVIGILMIIAYFPLKKRFHRDVSIENKLEESFN